MSTPEPDDEYRTEKLDLLAKQLNSRNLSEHNTQLPHVDKLNFFNNSASKLQRLNETNEKEKTNVAHSNSVHSIKNRKGKSLASIASSAYRMHKMADEGSTTSSVGSATPSLLLSKLRAVSVLSFIDEEKEEEPQGVNSVRFSSLDYPPIDIEVATVLYETYRQTRIPKNCQASFKYYLLTKDSMNIMSTVFWFVFCSFFQKEDMQTEKIETLVHTMSTSMRNLFWLMNRKDRDTFYELYHYVLSYTTLRLLFKHFPGSKKLFSDNFKMRVYELVSELVTGVRLRKNSIEAKIDRLFPKRHTLDGEPEEEEENEEGEEEKIVEPVEQQPLTEDEVLSKYYKEKKERQERYAEAANGTGSGIDPSQHYINRVNQKYNEFTKKVNQRSKNGESEGYKSPKFDPESFHAAVVPKSADEDELSMEIYAEMIKKAKARGRKMSKSPEDVKKQERSASTSPTKVDNNNNNKRKKKSNLDTRSWHSYTMSPLMSRFMRPPIEFSKSSNQHLLPKQGVDNVFFFGSNERTMKDIQKHEPKSIEMFKKSLIRQKMILEADEKSKEEAKRTIRWVRRKAKSDLKKIEADSRDFVKDKDRCLDELYTIIVQERKEKQEKLRKSGLFVLENKLDKTHGYEYHWKEELSLKHIDFKGHKQSITML